MMRTFTVACIFALSLSLSLSYIVPAAARHATDAVVFSWEQCHIQTLRLGFDPRRRAYVNHMMHCLAGRKGK